MAVPSNTGTRLWRAGEALVLLVACLSFYNMYRSLILSLSLIHASSASVRTSFWDGYEGVEPQWKYAGPDSSSEYWFNETRHALATMQDTYWNGTYWPSTIQWIGALINTILAATETTFVDGLQAYGDSKSAPQLETDILHYYSQIQAYYENEDTIQIFDQAYDDAQWDKFDTSLCGGGLTWNPALETYKNAITNELFVSSSISMFLYFPSDNNTDPYPHPDYFAQTNKTLPSLTPLAAYDPSLLKNAKQGWEWFKSKDFTNSQGLIVDGFHNSANQTECDLRNEMVYTYNQGVMLTGLRGLWEATGDTSYLDDGYSLIHTVVNATGFDAEASVQASEWAGLGRNGILEDYCDAPANCSQDNLIFKGAYFQHFDYFCTALPTRVPLVDGISVLASEELARYHNDRCQVFSRWVQHNAHAALSTRDATEMIGEWWGAPYLNMTQGPAPGYAAPKPAGSIDICNEPWLQHQFPWKCTSKDCHLPSIGRGYTKRSSALHPRQLGADNRTVETQAQGLAVIRAATDLTLLSSSSDGSTRKVYE